MQTEVAAPTSLHESVADAAPEREVATASIIIVNYNTRELLRQCLTSLEHCGDESQIIVVDNASNDNSCEMLAEGFPRVQVVPLSSNVGFGRANNRGLEEATGDFIILLNSDTVLKDDSLDRCVRWMEDHPELGAVSPKLMGFDGVPQQCQHRFPSLGDAVRKAFRRDVKPTRSESELWLAGTCLVLRRSAIEAAGGLFDPALFMYWEDADLSSRLLGSGWQLGVCEDAEIVHYGGASGGGEDAKRRPDLEAWYTFGRHHWFSKHRPIWERCVLWGMEFFDCFRCFVRGTLHNDRGHERVRARVLMGVLVKRLLGLSPKPLG